MNRDWRAQASQILAPENLPPGFLSYVADYVLLNNTGITSGQVIGSDFYARQLDANGTQLDVVSTASDTVIYTNVIGGGTLKTDGALRLLLLGDYKNSSGTGKTFTLTVTFGSTIMYKDATGSFTSTANRAPMHIDLYLSAADSPSAQTLSGFVTEGDRFGAVTTGIGDLATAAGVFGVGGTAAEDTSVNKTLEVKLQHSASDANVSYRRNFALLTKIGH